MKATDDDVRAALGGEGARRGPDRAQCPAPEVLARAAEGAPERPPVEIADHVAGCADCALELRLASALKPWAEGAAATLSRPASRASRWLPLALAASLAVSLGLSAWVLALRQQGDRLQARLADARQSLPGAGHTTSPTPPTRPEMDTGTAVRLTQPHANVALVDLFPRDATRGGTTAVATVDASRGPLVVFILNVRQPESGATYAVEIVDARGTAVWASEAIRSGAEPVTLAVPTHLLSGDAYRIRLLRLRGGDRTLVEQYELRVERPRRITP